LNFSCLGDPKLRDLGQFMVLQINYDVIKLQTSIMTSLNYVT